VGRGNVGAMVSTNRLSEVVGEWRRRMATESVKLGQILAHTQERINTGRNLTS